ncbi:MAG TPA: hypothetical protein VNI54_05880 [Thermoanaerobaculia bacterium]|nr:hypothetical protein [Thermoanaerobaculia bacterium]
MRSLIVVASLLLAGSALAADPVYIDQLMEQSVSALRTTFPGLKKEGCFRIGAERFLLIAIDKKDQKPWRVMIANTAPCRRPEDVTGLDVRDRRGIEVGLGSMQIIEKLGRPDAAAAPDPTLRKLGDTEYFYICRVSDGCARHTSVFVRDGQVTAFGEWYSQ